MKLWPKKHLGDLVVIEKGKKAPKVFALPTRTCVRYLQIEDLRPNTSIKYCEPFNCPKATNSEAIIAWDGANAGTVSCHLEGLIGSTLAVLRPIDANALSPVFLSRFLGGNFHYLQRTAVGATIPHISKEALNSLQIPLPPLAEQVRIVRLLDEADELRKLRAQADRRTADFIPALFHKMFGDADFPQNPLGDAAEVVSGVAKGRRFNGQKPISVPYVRVANVQDGYLDLSELKKIEALSVEVEKLSLRKGDVLMTEGGDFNKLGRGAMLERDLPNCIHQNHVFRVRCNQKALLPDYFAKFLLTQSAKSYFLRCAKRTSNLASINMTQLRALPVPVPPLPLQKEFVQQVTEIRALESAQGKSHARLDGLFASLLDRAFKGEL